MMGRLEKGGQMSGNSYEREYGEPLTEYAYRTSVKKENEGTCFGRERNAITPFLDISILSLRKMIQGGHIQELVYLCKLA